MKFTEIKTLLDKGFTPDQIMNLAENVNEPETKPEDPTPEKQDIVSQPETDDRFAALEKTISELTKTIQANAIANSLQPGQSVKSDMDILASVLNPSGNK